MRLKLKKSEGEVTKLLRAAKPLYGVGNGRKTRTMIDAVRDAYFGLRNPSSLGDWRWAGAMAALDEAVGRSGVIGGFQAWEDEEGRTIEERLAAFDRAIEAAAPERTTD